MAVIVRIQDIKAGQENLMTIKEVMKVLCISRPTLYRWVKKKKLRPVKVGQGRTTFFIREDIESLGQGN